MPLRVMVAAEKPLDGELTLVAPDGTVAAKSGGVRGGPPYYWFAEVATPAVGKWQATLTRGGAPCVSREIIVAAQKPPGPGKSENSVWPIHANWNRATEDLFSAWITKLFDAPLETEPSWKAWHLVLRDQSRNFLFNYLGNNEDNVALSLKPDCADFVYFLRAYFAFKLGLPFAYSNCSRGMGGAPPKCYQWFDIMHPEVTRPAPPPEQVMASAPSTAPEPPPTPSSKLAQLFGQKSEPAPAAVAPPAPPPPPHKPNFGEYLRAVGDVVHSGSVRVAATDDNTDFLHGAADGRGAPPRRRLCRPLWPRDDAGATGCRKPTAMPAFSSPSMPSRTAR